VAIGNAGQVISDHLLVVLEADAGQHHRPPRLDADRFLSAFGAHAEDFLGDIMLDQLPGRCLVEDRDGPFLHQPLGRPQTFHEADCGP